MKLFPVLRQRTIQTGGCRAKGCHSRNKSRIITHPFQPFVHVHAGRINRRVAQCEKNHIPVLIQQLCHLTHVKIMDCFQPLPVFDHRHGEKQHLFPLRLRTCPPGSLVCHAALQISAVPAFFRTAVPYRLLKFRIGYRDCDHTALPDHTERLACNQFRIPRTYPCPCKFSTHICVSPSVIF